MKLGILIPQFPTQTHIFFWRELQALEACGVSVELLSTKAPDEPCPHDFARAAVARTHYTFPPSPRAVARSLLSGRFHRVAPYLASLSDRGKKLLSDAALSLSAADLVRYSKKKGIDHIHVHSCGDAAHLIAMAYLLGGPSYSLHLHGDLPVYGRDHAQKMKNALFVAAAARPMQRQLIEQVGLPEHRTRTMLMGVDTSRFQPADASPRQGPLELITVSRLHHCKGHQHALSALRIALDAGANLRYTIVGEGPHAAAIREHIARLNLGSHVSMLGSRSEAEIKDLLRRSHAFLLTSVGLGEASPVAVMESMASAVPPICSIIGGTPDMISDAVDGLLVPQQDEQAIAAAIRRLHDDDHFRIALGRAARSRAESQFDSKVLAQRLISTIQELKGIRAARHGGGDQASAAPAESRLSA